MKKQQKKLCKMFFIVNKKIDDFRGDSDLYTWIYRITANLCLKAKSKLNKERIYKADIKKDG